eukprot:m.141230 g.141230  ORF g.141230 m.141230 type:complete len:284 (-) comp22851_c0_seq1:298-1149(-)
MQMMWIRLSMVLAAVGAVHAVAEGDGAAFPRPARQACCMAFTVHCLSCSAGMTQMAYCAQEPRPSLCANWVAPTAAPPPPPPTVADCSTLSNCNVGQQCLRTTCFNPPCPYSCVPGGTTCSFVSCSNGRPCMMINGRPSCTAAPTMAPTRSTMSPTLPPVDSPTQLPTAVPTSSAPTAVPTSSAPTVFPTMTPPPSQTPTTAAPTVVTPQSSSGTGTSSSSDHTILYVIVAVLLVVAVFAIMALVKVSKDKQHASAAAQVNPSFAVNYEDGGQDYLDVTASSE